MEHLTAQLDFLGLPYLRDEFSNIIEDAVKKNTSIMEFFSAIVEAEAAAKRQRITERRITQARFPQRKYIDNFDWNHPTKIDVELVRYLFTLKFMEGEYKKNVIFTVIVPNFVKHEPILLKLAQLAKKAEPTFVRNSILR